MSLYNNLFGNTPDLKNLLKILDLSTEKAGRIRDAYVDKNEKGEYIVALFTRNGGGNRDCWEFPGCKDGEHDWKCMVSIVKNLQAHPHYICDYDDEFDCTYATFEFSVPQRYFELAEHVYCRNSDKTKPMEKFNELLKKMKTGNTSDPEVSKALNLGKGIIDKVSGALKRKRKKK